MLTVCMQINQWILLFINPSCIYNITRSYMWHTDEKKKEKKIEIMSFDLHFECIYLKYIILQGNIQQVLTKSLPTCLLYLHI